MKIGNSLQGTNNRERNIFCTRCGRESVAVRWRRAPAESFSCRRGTRLRTRTRGRDAPFLRNATRTGAAKGDRTSPVGV
ncbi:MAG: hypothetical protein KME30_17050 [Iphinoe sp. HA4291-MV1]|nr:hypothetical protein [Iphinoe sp. HA4291-MV1]